MGSIVDWTWLRKNISEFEDVLFQMFKQKKQKKKKEIKENGAEYPRILLGQLQKV